MDLAPYAAINPCGYEGMAVTQMSAMPQWPRRAAIVGRVWPKPRPATGDELTHDDQAERRSQDRAHPDQGGAGRNRAEEALDWIRVKAGNSAARFGEIKQILREHKLHTVCEEATCPNIGECFGNGTATFMILGDLCTRRCPFCDVGHGKPLPPDAEEPEKLARTIAAMKLKYVVITSVDRDDLRDGGAQHFADCIAKVREYSPGTKIEVLVPDFRGRLDIASTSSPPRRPT
jgi:lipoate synthase